MLMHCNCWVLGHIRQILYQIRRVWELKKPKCCSLGRAGKGGRLCQWGRFLPLHKPARLYAPPGTREINVCKRACKFFACTWPLQEGPVSLKHWGCKLSCRALHNSENQTTYMQACVWISESTSHGCKGCGR